MTVYIAIARYIYGRISPYFAMDEERWITIYPNGKSPKADGSGDKKGQPVLRVTQDEWIEKPEGWFTTENGTHIPLKNGQSKDDAVREFFTDKGKKAEKSKKLTGEYAEEVLPSNDGASKEVIGAFREYATYGVNINENLRKGEVTEWQKGIIDTIDAYIAESAGTSEDAQFSRGVFMRDFLGHDVYDKIMKMFQNKELNLGDEIGFLKGKEITNKGYTSVGWKWEQVGKFGESTVYIDAPKGSKIVKSPFNHYGEGEAVIGRNSRFRIDSITFNWAGEEIGVTFTMHATLLSKGESE